MFKQMIKGSFKNVYWRTRQDWISPRYSRKFSTDPKPESESKNATDANSSSKCVTWQTKIIFGINVLSFSYIVLIENDEVKRPVRGMRGPITFASLGLCLVTGGLVLLYYNFERERKLEKTASEVNSVGKIATL